MLYTISATVSRPVPGGYYSTRSLPLFFLDSRVQGILDADHAARVAVSLLRDAAGDDAEVIASAYPSNRETVGRASSAGRPDVTPA